MHGIRTLSATISMLNVELRILSSPTNDICISVYTLNICAKSEQYFCRCDNYMFHILFNATFVGCLADDTILQVWILPKCLSRTTHMPEMLPNTNWKNGIIRFVHFIFDVSHVCKVLVKTFLNDAIQNSLTNRSLIFEYFGRMNGFTFKCCNGKQTHFVTFWIFTWRFDWNFLRDTVSFFNIRQHLYMDLKKTEIDGNVFTSAFFFLNQLVKERKRCLCSWCGIWGNCIIIVKR